MQTVRFVYQTVLVVLAAGTLQAQPVVIKEIPGGNSSFSVIGDLVYFQSADSLYRTDGTTAGTIFLKKLQARAFKEFKGTVYFSASASGGGQDLWKSDGTSSGTIKLKNFSAITFIEHTGDVLFFLAVTDATGRELYKTNGTPEGTVLVKEINAGPANGIPDFFHAGVADNNLIFPANDGLHGIELWKSDGSAGGTQMIEDINPGEANGFVNKMPVADNNKFYFVGSSPQYGTDPWVSDGTSEGTLLLKDILPGETGFVEIVLAAGRDGFVYFTTHFFSELQGDVMHQLWKTNGTIGETLMVKDIPTESFLYSRFLSYKGSLYFFLNLYNNGRFLLWTTDGTAAGTQEIFSGNLDGDIPFLEVVNDNIIFYTTVQGHSGGFYRSDGTSSGTTQFMGFKSHTLFGHIVSAAKVDNMVFYADHDGPVHPEGGHALNPEDHFQLMQTDGFTVESLRSILGISFKGTSDIVNFNGSVLFTTQDSISLPKQLWIYDPNRASQDSASLTLVNADNDEDIQTLSEGDTITKPADTFFNIRYNPAETPGSVVFKHQDKIVRIENSAPFSLRGDYSGDFIPWEAGIAGNHKVEAIPYSEPRGRGTRGTSLVINFTIVDESPEECLASGTILREFWTGVSGARIEHIPLDTKPTSTNELTIFEGPENIGMNYATRIRGYLCPPATGDYIFWIASNDHSELWLSTDDNPSHKARIAYVTGATEPRQWNKFRTQRSVPIWLEQGNRYYIEGLHKQGVGSDHIAVGWQLPDGTLERPVPGIRLSPFESDTSTMVSMAEARYSQINIYPNPARSGTPELTIAGYEEIKETIETQVEIVNMTGEVIFKERVVCGGDCTAYLMNINKQLVPGVYMVNLYTNNNRTAKRLLVK